MGHAMRYYEVYKPGVRTPLLLSNVKDLTNLPLGTFIWRTITERDGSLIEQEEIEVRDGRAVIQGHGKQRPQILKGRPR